MEVIVAAVRREGRGREWRLLELCCVCRGRDVNSDVGSDVCDMENPLSRSEFLLKNLHTRELLPLCSTSPPLPPLAYI